MEEEQILLKRLQEIRDCKSINTNLKVSQSPKYAKLDLDNYSTSGIKDDFLETVKERDALNERIELMKEYMKECEIELPKNCFDSHGRARRPYQIRGMWCD